ncbi:MAG TPA: DUF2079 domain-containing protein [Gaiellaceae bacterium]|nr:DUF2079 domain-containing protein [Gaiellaceae bacterium]
MSAAETDARASAGELALRGRLARVAGAAAHPRAIVYSASGLFALLFAAAAVVEFRAFQGQRLDLGDMTQAVWATAHGHFLRVTASGGHEFLRLGVHVDPFLALLAPLWWIWPSPLMLLVVQVLAVGSGALPVYWLARKRLGDERAAVGFAAAYLIYPATQFNALTDSGPHAVSFAVPLILFAIWFLDNDRLVPFALTALLAASTKEEIPLAVGCLGIWYAVTHGRRLVGAAIFALGLAGTLVDFLVVIPHFAPAGSGPFEHRYSAVGGSPGGIAHTLLTHPGTIAAAVASSHKLHFLLLLLLPFAGLWLLEPLLVLGAVPDLAIDLLSSKPDQTTLGFQYTAGIVPFVVAAAVLGAARAKGRAAPTRLAAYAVALTAVFAIWHTPLRSAFHDLPGARGSSPLRQAKAHALSLVPSGVPVTATNQFGGYLSSRRLIYVFPSVGKARWAIVDVQDPSYSDKVAERQRLARMEASPAWHVAFASHGVAVLRKQR